MESTRRTSLKQTAALSATCFVGFEWQQSANAVETTSEQIASRELLTNADGNHEWIPELSAGRLNL